MKRSACLIHNPVAGQGDSEAELQRIRELLEPEIDLDIRLTTKQVDADKLARTAVKEEALMVIVSGGDGTMSAATSALVRTCIPLGVISRGTQKVALDGELIGTTPVEIECIPAGLTILVPKLR